MKRKVPVGVRARERAELAMRRIRTMEPTIQTAWEMYVRAWAAYEDEMQVLRQYKKRGHVTVEEVEAHTLKRKSLADGLKRYREGKKNG